MSIDQLLETVLHIPRAPAPTATPLAWRSAAAAEQRGRRVDVAHASRTSPARALERLPRPDAGSGPRPGAAWIDRAVLGHHDTRQSKDAPALAWLLAITQM